MDGTKHRCLAVRDFAAKQLDLGRNISVHPNASITSAHHTLVCLASGQVWWQKSEKKQHEWATFPDRLVGTLQLFHQLQLRSNGTLQPGCLWVSIVDEPLDGEPANDDGLVGAWLSSHRHNDAAQRPGTFMWPEFDYEARLLEYQPPLPMIQRAAWARPVAWSQRNRSAYTKASLGIYHHRRDVKACSQGRGNVSRAFADGRLQVKDMVHTGHLIGSRCTRENESETPLHYTSSCTTNWTPSPQDWLDHYREHRFNIFLPGQQDWSTTFQMLMSLGGALVVPDDLQTATLWTSLIDAYCKNCTISYTRGKRVCSSLVEAISVPDDIAEQAAANLHGFVQHELNEQCIYDYMELVLNGLQHEVTPDVHELQGLGFNLFDCEMQHQIVGTMGVGRRAAVGTGAPERHHDAYFDPESCRRRSTPKPLPFFMNCTSRGAPFRIPGGGARSALPKLNTALAWCS